MLHGTPRVTPPPHRPNFAKMLSTVVLPQRRRYWQDMCRTCGEAVQGKRMGSYVACAYGALFTGGNSVDHGLTARAQLRGFNVVMRQRVYVCLATTLEMLAIWIDSKPENDKVPRPDVLASSDESHTTMPHIRSKTPTPPSARRLRSCRSDSDGVGTFLYVKAWRG